MNERSLGKQRHIGRWLLPHRNFRIALLISQPHWSFLTAESVSEVNRVRYPFPCQSIQYLLCSLARVGRTRNNLLIVRPPPLAHQSSSLSIPLFQVTAQQFQSHAFLLQQNSARGTNIENRGDVMGSFFLEHLVMKIRIRLFVLRLDSRTVKMIPVWVLTQTRKYEVMKFRCWKYAKMMPLNQRHDTTTTWML